MDSLHRPRLRRAGEHALLLVAELLALLLVLVTVIALLARTISSGAQPLIVLASGAHFALWAAFPALAIAAALRRVVTSAVAAVVSVFVLLVQVPPTIASTAPADARHVVVMQANLAIGFADPATIVGLVRDHDVDLLATEELTPPALVGLIRAGLTDVLRYHYNQPIASGAAGIGIWSRYPISDPVADPRFLLGLRHVGIAVPGAPLTFVVTHVSAPYPQPPDLWRSDFERLPGVLAALPDDAPVLVAGDFNATVDHAPFRAVLDAGYADGADQAGAGYLPSYPADRLYPPMIAIDHVLTRDAVATAADTFTVAGSDHRSLIVDVAVPLVGA